MAPPARMSARCGNHARQRAPAGEVEPQQAVERRVQRRQRQASCRRRVPRRCRGDGRQASSPFRRPRALRRRGRARVIGASVAAAARSRVARSGLRARAPAHRPEQAGKRSESRTEPISTDAPSRAAGGADGTFRAAAADVDDRDALAVARRIRGRAGKRARRFTRHRQESAAARPSAARIALGERGARRRHGARRWSRSPSSAHLARCARADEVAHGGKRPLDAGRRRASAVTQALHPDASRCASASERVLAFSYRAVAVPCDRSANEQPMRCCVPERNDGAACAVGQ